MNIDNDAHGTFNGPAEVRLVRLLPGPIERIWDYLTDPEKRARWFAGGPMEPRTGGKMRLHFRHANLAPGEEPPEEYREVQDTGVHMDGAVLRWEPPRVLSYTFGDTQESEVTFELTPQGDRVMLVLTHRSRGEDLPYTSGYASGWHLHLDHLRARLEGVPLSGFWAAHRRLKAEYEKIRAALPA